MAEMDEFGIGNDTNSSNKVNFKGGITKGYLKDVKAHEIGKGETKYFVLDFIFVDEEGIRTLEHREFVPKGKANQKKTEEEDYKDKRNRFNSRIKHIYDAFAVLGENERLGAGAKDWNDFFVKIADAFNKGKDGNPIYKGVKIYIKATYNQKNDIQLPLLPNFIEKITKDNEHGYKKLEINKQYDKIIQTDVPSANAPGNFGGGAPPAPGGNADFF